MIGDNVLVAGKEIREVVLRAGGSKATMFNLVLILGVFGILMPLQAGPEWVTRPWLLFAWTWLPLFLVSALVADSFAGERERHTLETLLTTALSDTAILFGKMIAAVAYGYGMLVAVMVTSLLTVNVVHAAAEGRLLLFRPWITATVLVIGLLVTLFVAALGVMISINAKTVRQAGQTLSLGILAVIWIPGVLLGYVYRTLPTSQQVALWEAATMLDGRLVALWTAGGLLVLDALFVGLAAGRFKRNRLTLD